MFLVPLLNPKFATVPAAKSCELRVRGTSAAARWSGFAIEDASRKKILPVVMPAFPAGFQAASCRARRKGSGRAARPAVARRRSVPLAGGGPRRDLDLEQPQQRGERHAEHAKGDDRHEHLVDLVEIGRA